MALLARNTKDRRRVPKVPTVDFIEFLTTGSNRDNLKAELTLRGPLWSFGSSLRLRTFRR